MTTQDRESFGQALKNALRTAGLKQVELAGRLYTDPGQVSRWVNDKAVPHADTVARMEDELGVDLSDAFQASAPTCELYVSAPITGLGSDSITAHHEAVDTVVQAAGQHVNSFYWPGQEVRTASDLIAPDIATERNLRSMQHCSAFLYLQFAEIMRPSGSLIELGIALGRRLKTTAIILADVKKPPMLSGFGAVASNLSFLPKARIYTVDSVYEARDLVERTGRELLGLS